MCQFIVKKLHDLCAKLLAGNPHGGQRRRADGTEGDIINADNGAVVGKPAAVILQGAAAAQGDHVVVSQKCRRYIGAFFQKRVHFLVGTCHRRGDGIHLFLFIIQPESGKSIQIALHPDAEIAGIHGTVQVADLPVAQTEKIIHGLFHDLFVIHGDAV